MNPSTAILSAFYEAGDKFVSVGELRRRLAVSSVPEQIAELKTIGYRIESHPHLGYRLASAPDRLLADDLRARMRSQLIGSEILIFDEIASTNDIMRQLAESGAREGLVVFAESQTRGRGRQGRTWVSPRGKGLWFSILLRPELAATAMSRLTVAASVAVARAVREVARVDARIKWPNDVTVRGRKLAGILTEVRDGAIVLGIGINVNCEPADFPRELDGLATSVQIETGHPHDRAELAARVMDELDKACRTAVSDFEAVSDEWAGWCTTLGKHITITMGRRRVEGYAQALDGDGALLVRKDNGHMERIVGGDLVKECA